MNPQTKESQIVKFRVSRGTVVDGQSLNFTRELRQILMFVKNLSLMLLYKFYEMIFKIQGL